MTCHATFHAGLFPVLTVEMDKLFPLSPFKNKSEVYPGKKQTTQKVVGSLSLECSRKGLSVALGDMVYW